MNSNRLAQDSNQLPMGKCPFCAEPVLEDTLLFGGPCPKCFGVIPGEEVATHPGFEVIAQQAAQDDRRSTFRTLIPLLVAVPVLGGVVALAIGIVILNQDPVIEPLDFDEIGGFEYDIVAAPPDAPEEPTKVAETPKTPKGPRPAKPVGVEAPVAAPLPTPAPGGIADARPRTPPKLDGLFNNDLVSVKRSGVEITDDGQIATMIRGVLQAESGKLATCYNEALVRNPDLKGGWRMKFVVSKAGYAEDISFTGREMQDAPMEACLARLVSKWSFGRIVHPQPVQKSYTFRR